MTHGGQNGVSGGKREFLCGVNLTEGILRGISTGSSDFIVYFLRYCSQKRSLKHPGKNFSS